MNLAAGTVFNGLKLLELCGGGAYGEVRLCEDISGCRMAVKIVSKSRLGGVWERELQGVRNYRRITGDSPDLLRIFHVGEDEECFYYTMEAADSADPERYVPDTLAHRLQSGPLPPELLYPVLRGIFDGIKTIHEAGFAHRDIKPDNIIFVEGVPKLGDIGLVSSLSNSMTGLAGTLEFLPPEVRSSDAPDSGDRSSRQRNDLYAFGKVVYCAATGLEPRMYPSLPTGAKLSPELKMFWDLASRLCSREPLLRIRDLRSLEREMDKISSRLETGETFASRLRPALSRLSRWILSGILAAGRALRKIWWLPTLIVLAGGACYRFLWDRQPDDRSELREYVVKSLGVRMRIPAYWQPMSETHIRALVGEMTKELNETAKSEEAKQMLRNSIEKAKRWQGLIRCDLYDTIEIFHVGSPEASTERLWTMPGEELKRELMAQYEMLRSEDAKVYELKRTTLGGRRCVAVDFTLDGHDRIKNCMFIDPGGITIIALTADAATFPRRRREFDAALATLEFTKPVRRE